MDSRQFTALVGAIVLTLSSHAVIAGQVYRYLNDQGILVINDKVPPEYIPKGYDVLDSSSLTLIQRVPRQLTEEELRLHNTDESRAMLKAEEERRMQAWDQSLMLRYSSIEDIQAAQKRAIQDLQIRISILKSNLVTIKAHIESEQQKAADIERRGVEVPDELLRNIDVLRREIQDTEQSITVRREEIATVKASYQRDMDRFTTLLDRVEMRRQSGQTQTVDKMTHPDNH